MGPDPHEFAGPRIPELKRPPLPGNERGECTIGTVGVDRPAAGTGAWFPWFIVYGFRRIPGGVVRVRVERFILSLAGLALPIPVLAIPVPTAVRTILVLLLVWWPAGSAEALTLEEAISLSLSRNERSGAADEASRAAEARVARARAFFLPDLMLTAGYSVGEDLARQDGAVDPGPRSRESSEARAGLALTLFDARGFPLLQQARHLRTAARLEANGEKRRLSFDTSRAFLSVLNDEQVARAGERRFDLARRNLDEFRVRFDAQLVSSNDVTRAELEAASAEREMVRAHGTARISGLELGYLLGTELVDSLAIPADLLADAALGPEAIMAGLPSPLERDPAVEAGRSRLAALRASAREPLMRYLPALGLDGAAWSTGDDGFDGQEDDWEVGLGLTWSVFDGGEREAERSERLALARQTEFDLRGLERRVVTDVEVARVALESEQASLARAEVAVEVARRNAVETAELYRQGLVRALEVVDANVQLFEAEVERAGAFYGVALALLGLREAAGVSPLERTGK